MDSMQGAVVDARRDRDGQGAHRCPAGGPTFRALGRGHRHCGGRCDAGRADSVRLRAGVDRRQAHLGDLPKPKAQGNGSSVVLGVAVTHFAPPKMRRSPTGCMPWIM
jgi:hypothetical protein